MAILDSNQTVSNNVSETLSLKSKVADFFWEKATENTIIRTKEK